MYDPLKNMVEQKDALSAWHAIRRNHTTVKGNLGPVYANSLWTWGTETMPHSATGPETPRLCALGLHASQEPDHALECFDEIRPDAQSPDKLLLCRVKVWGKVFHAESSKKLVGNYRLVEYIVDPIPAVRATLHGMFAVPLKQYISTGSLPLYNEGVQQLLQPYRQRPCNNEAVSDPFGYFRRLSMLISRVSSVSYEATALTLLERALAYFYTRALYDVIAKLSGPVLRFSAKDARALFTRHLEAAPRIEAPSAVVS